MRLSLSLIRLDGGTQSRARLDDDRVAQYVDAIGRGDTMPPVEVFFDGSSYWLWDGFHRVEAHVHAGQSEVAARVQSGTVDDAVWQSLAANKDHDKAGKPRSRADVQRSIERALRHPRGASTSNAKIALHIGCDPKTVNAARERLVATQEIPESTARVGADGRTINTENIGKRPALAPVAAPPARHDPPAFLEGPGWVAAEDDDEPPVEVEPVKINPAPPPRRWGDDDMSALIANVATIAVDAEHALARISKLFDSADPSRRVEAIERCKNFVLNVANAALAQLPQSAVERRAAFAVIGGGKKTS